ncbi:hypothetical protein E3Q22_00008 [Wallemia mellicola]|uniref:Nucleotide-diphospho-sugar transferase n=2 Tax=Wallemia mellicola TaxID=1708541 RepID=A0A4T0LX66_9BASI|nr:hypothetical protein WALSEDRAFT_59201 [Wallemia mellicola CBS 633.66]TIB74771.1 hypothetical protein E3Q24_00293 [Wallemia mellicola]EIM24312.1 hypothetical protein WALSEDRAFT_59201 [Wallemia mellicola CBS 633.66]TIB82689.1 hypothetical protein E3Q22_00008 [Wallemia mellicola]TIB83947.1 hypothetical protein E3Q21_02608 [Wallemia mellicola]TIB87043.1 hypothetical protein E3Q20_02654 [Wallemia mellicola]|eukprot:XP_006956123.1 hypothetical protein WALSEDRAFT_59201 [Wallemia mellicola CBS 633.66]
MITRRGILVLTIILSTFSLLLLLNKSSQLSSSDFSHLRSTFSHRPAIYKYPTQLPDLPDQLSSRLADILDQPALNHTEAYDTNSAICLPKTHELLGDTQQLKEELENWENVTPEEILNIRSQIINHLEVLGDDAVYDFEKAGLARNETTRGLVITAGNKDTHQRAITSLKLLRNMNFTWPAEIFQYRDERLSTDINATYASLNATVRYIDGVTKDVRSDDEHNYQIKAHAIRDSSFREVLYMDSDNIPIRNPDVLFEDPMYSDSSSPRVTFWPDFQKDHPANPIWRILGIPCKSDEWRIDSGQIMFDKAGNDGMNLAALHIAAFMADNHKYWFKLAGGDKDTFRYAFHFLRIPYVHAPNWLAAGGAPTPISRDKNIRFCGHTKIQFDLNTFEPRPVFAHAQLLKGANSDTTTPSQVFASVKKSSKALANKPSSGSAIEIYDGPRGKCFNLLGGKKDSYEIWLEDLMRFGTDPAYHGWRTAKWERQWRQQGGFVGGW